MKRILAFVLMLMSLAGPAIANTLVVMAPDHEPASSANDIHYRDLQFNMVTETLRRAGAPYRSIRGLQGLKTEWLRSGDIPNGNGPNAPVVHYDCVVYCGFYNNNSTWPSSPSCRPDSTTLTKIVSGQSMWPSVPTIFLAHTKDMCSGITPAATCSLGVDACIPIGSLTPYGRGYLAGVGFPYMFFTGGRPIGVKVATIKASKFREIICYGVSAGSNCTAAALMAKDPDSTVSVNAANDSILLAALYGPVGVTTGGVTVANVPIFVGYPGTEGYQDETVIKTALMMADSASGGNVFTNQSKLPIGRNIWLTGGFTRGIGNSAVTTGSGGGIRCSADSCDSVNVKAGIDSMASLGVPFTLGVNSDSIASYPYEVAWWARAPLCHYALEEHTGVVAGTFGDAAANHPVDPFSSSRTRTVQATCSGTFDTTNVLCHLKQGMANLNANFSGKVDHSVYPAYGDWSPTNFTRNTTSAASFLSDEWVLFWDLWASGFRTMVFHPGISPMVGQDGYLSSGTWNVSSGAAAPIGYEADERTVPVYYTGIAPPGGGLGWIVGQLNLLATRYEPQQPLWSWLPAVHQAHTEFNNGNSVGLWSYDNPINYRHMFFTRTSVLMQSAAGLGSTSLQRTDVFPGMQSFRVIKWAVNQTKIANYFATTWPNGTRKTLDKWDYAENLVARP